MAKIIVIDDEPIVLDLVSTALQMDGHTVTALSNPLALFEMDAGEVRSVDLLLTDISMKPISGLELFKRLMEADIHPPVLFMSGYTGVTEALREQWGANTVIEKPFTVRQLHAAVRELLGGDQRVTAQSS